MDCDTRDKRVTARREGERGKKFGGKEGQTRIEEMNERKSSGGKKGENLRPSGRRGRKVQWRESREEKRKKNHRWWKERKRERRKGTR